MYKPKQKYPWLPSENSSTTRRGVSRQCWHGLGWTDVSRFSDDTEQCSCPAATIQLAGEGMGRGLPTCPPACLSAALGLPCRKKWNKQQKIWPPWLALLFFWWTISELLFDGWMVVYKPGRDERQSVPKKKKKSNSQSLKSRITVLQVMTDLLQTFSLKVHCFAVLAGGGLTLLAAEWAGVPHEEKMNCESEAKLWERTFCQK